jgi:hypothetical protein
VDARLAELGVTDLADALRGELSVSYAADGARLLIASLGKGAPSPSTLEVSSAPPPLRRGCFDLAVETDAVSNALGGRYGAFALGSSIASVDQDPDQEGRRVLRVRCSRVDGGCGIWIQLFNAFALRRTFLDASRIARLVFWARARGDYQLKVADAAWARREDALPVAAVSGLMAGAASPSGWRRVEVPLASLPRGVAHDSLAMLVLEAEAPGESQLEVVGVQLCAPGGGAAESLPPPADEKPAPREAHRALWVWNTAELLADSAAERRFLDFVQGGAFDRVFMQLVPAEGAEAVAGWVPFDGERLGRLVAELERRGAEVYALDGDPSYALPENHEGVLRTLRALLEHNRTAPEERRLHGVRYDIEPYALPAFRSAGRDALLTGYLDLLSSISVEARGQLRLGLDIPFWFDAPEAPTGRPISLSWRGQERTLLDHLLGQVDDVAVMAYRTSAYGADGSLALADGELRAAAEAGVDVYVGMETERLPDEESYAFGEPRRGLPPATGGTWVVGASLPDGVARFWLVAAGQAAALEPAIIGAGVSAEAVFYWRAEPPTRIPGARLSFDSLGARRLEVEAGRILRELGSKPAFAGLAYHHYGSLSRLPL